MSLVPHFIHERFGRQDLRGHFPAAVVRVDISGFTPLTETLMQHGRDGAEVLSEVLAAIFNPLVAEVYACGGFISGFAGDAFTAIFPCDEASPSAAPQRALQSASFAQRFFAERGLVQTRYGPFHTSAKVALALGEVEWGILGTAGQHAYYFRGPAIRACAQAEDQAAGGDLIADRQIWPSIQPYVEAAPLEEHFRLLALRSWPELPRLPSPPPLPREALAPFVLDAVVEFALRGARGEFRKVASAFVSFQADDAALGPFVSRVLGTAWQYGGYFKDVDFGDQGAVIVVEFGAPVAHENDLGRAANFLLDLADLQGLPGLVRWHAGLAHGTVYAGIMGGLERSEYTAIGDVVNLAARLAARAEWGQIWLSQAAAEGLSRDCRLERLGEFVLKGKSGTVPAYRLAGRRATSAEALFAGTMVGRQAELVQLCRFVQSIFAGQFAGVAYLYGEAGMGKSRLLHELRAQTASAPPGAFPAAADTSRCRDLGCSWFLCPADEVLRQSLNPFRHFLRRYFEQSPERSTEANRSRFDEILDRLIAALRAPVPGSEEGRGQGLVDELERTRSFLGALVDLRWEGSLYEQLEPKLRSENTVRAFVALIKAESVCRPVVLALEDLHWLDDDSQRLISVLARDLALGTGEEAAGYGVAIVCTSRSLDDGSRVQLELGMGVAQQVVELKALPRDGIQALAQQILAAPGQPARELSGELVAFLAEKTAGNPFFVEQLLLDSRERGALQVDDVQWTLRPGKMAEVPARISAVLIARLDRLTAPLRQVVQTAAVLGLEFDVPVLAQMLRGDALLPAEVQQAEAERIWWAVSELRYIFRHALMRDAAYEMQLQVRLRELHRLAAQALEQVYSAEPAPHFSDLAYHYGRAGDVAGECRYARLAGEQAAAQFANAQAVGYFSRALELTPADAPAERYALLLARERVHDLQGARKDQRQDLEALQGLAEALDDPPKRIEVGLRWAHAAEATGDYPGAVGAAQVVIDLAQRTADPAGEAAGYLQWGRALWRQGEYEAARSCLQQALSRARAAAERHLEADSLHNLGTTYFYLGDYPAAREHYGQGLEIYRQVGNQQGEGSALNNLANISANQGNYAEARAYYERSLHIKRAIGDRKGEGNTLNNLGNAHADQADYSRAIACYRQSLHICREIGDRWGESAALGNLGNAFKNLGDYGTAWSYCQQALRLSREIGYRQIECIAVDNLGVLSLYQGHYAQAEAYLQESLHLCRERGDRRDETVTLINLGLVAHLMANDTAAREYSLAGLDIARDLGDRSRQGYALTVLGHSLAGLGALSEAAEAYQQALQIRRTLGEQSLAIESLAGLARVSLAQGNLPQARAQAEEILDHLRTHTLDGTDEPFRVYLTCYQVLAALDDPRAGETLSAAHTLLQVRAARIPDEGSRRSYLEDVAAHRAIARLFLQLTG